MRTKALIFFLLVSIPSPAFSFDTLEKLLPAAKLVGQATFTFAFWDIYNATLYAPEGKLSDSRPFALSIRYMREIDGSYIADISVRKIRGQGFKDEGKLAEWKQKMQEIFPDVVNGTVLSAIFIPDKETIFYQNNNKIGEVKDPDFTKWFSNIWLGENTSEPELRQKLLGLS